MPCTSEPGSASWWGGGAGQVSRTLPAIAWPAVGTERRNRQKELRRQHQEAVRAELQRQQRRRRAAWLGGAVVIVGLLVVGGVVLFGGGDSSTAARTTAAPTTVVPSDAVPGVESPVSDAPCPPAEGTDERITSFDGQPQRCIDPKANYTATFATTAGEFTAELDAEAAPATVNNFVVLARSHYYDGVAFHRIVPNFVIQSGDPNLTDDLGSLGTGNPGYYLAEEPPSDGQYQRYDLAMGKGQIPNSTGSQFFVVTGNPAGLEASPTYSRFGRVVTGKNVVDAIADTPVGGPRGDTPQTVVRIESVTITES